jgi:hypothetical protein
MPLRELNPAELNIPRVPRSAKRQHVDVQIADDADGAPVADMPLRELDVAEPNVSPVSRPAKRRRVANTRIADSADRCRSCKQVLSAEHFREGVREFRTCVACRSRVCNLSDFPNYADISYRRATPLLIRDDDRRIQIHLAFGHPLSFDGPWSSAG